LQTAAQIHQLAVQQGRAQALAEKEAEVCNENAYLCVQRRRPRAENPSKLCARYLYKKLMDEPSFSYFNIMLLPGTQ
jgi:hypothetical protein